MAAVDSAAIERRARTGDVLKTLIRADGSAAHLHAAGLLDRTALSRDLADAVHALCILHGHHPGMLDLALAGCRDEAARSWLDRSARVFALHRARLVRLSAAAGPLPSTPRQSDAEAAAAAQRHAFEMLARSDRSGCALGAAMALILDWHAIDAVLAQAADRFGLSSPTLPPLDTEDDVIALLAELSPGEAMQRATVFGAQQVLAQHRGLWSLLAARAEARGRD